VSCVRCGWCLAVARRSVTSNAPDDGRMHPKHVEFTSYYCCVRRTINNIVIVYVLHLIVLALWRCPSYTVRHLVDTI